MAPRFFKSPSELRAWLEKNHHRSVELQVGFFKLKSGKPSVTYQQALDEALCFGWIDGVRNGIDDERYAIRFTPRKRRSNWSRVNVRRAEELEALGLMHAAGLAAFRARDDARTVAYSYEEQYRRLDAASEKLFRRNMSAWRFFEAQPQGYRRLASWWVMSAKKEETRAKRLGTLIDDSAHGRRIGQLTRPPKKT